jgi:predicted small lipoprotein YifL
MRRWFAVLLALLMLTGCGAKGERGENRESENAPPAPAARPETDMPEDLTVTQGERVSLAGPYGTLSLVPAEGWEYELLEADNDDLRTCVYGIQFRPPGAQGWIQVGYCQSFGVCGTGLSQEEVTLAGEAAWIGTYDDLPYWDFVSWQGDLEGIVASRVSDGAFLWDEAQQQTAMEILDTIAFDREQRSGCIGYYTPEAEAEEIGLLLSLTDISPAGAVLNWNLYDPEAASGELQYGDGFTLEQEVDGVWVEVPYGVENAAFHDIAHLIDVEGTTEAPIDWSWLYGELSPGTYRLCKQVSDFRGSGDYDTYDLAACFLVN